jgi:hypothetical protein
MSDIEKLLRTRIDEISKFTRSHRAFAAELYFLEKEFGMLYLQNFCLRSKAFGEPDNCPVPAYRMPPDMVDKFSMGGKVKIVYGYRNESYPHNHPYIYTDSQIKYYMELQEHGYYFYYGMLDDYITQALKKHCPNGERVLNIGSITPWYDSLCVRLGYQPCTIDYNKIISLTDKTRTMTLDALRASGDCYSFALSISSIEHDGLGGYGDPLDPDGDLRGMKEMKNYIRKGGIMFFNVPIGEDAVCFNRERIYGRIRLPLLLEGWEIIDSYGYNDDVLDGKHPGPPLLVLRNT